MVRTRAACGAFLCSGIGAAVAAAPASAEIVFSENFNNAAFRGALVQTDTSDRWARTSYNRINMVNGWTFSGGDFLVRNEADTSNQALLLNEGGNSAQIGLVDLVIGDLYELSFLQWGDNNPGATYLASVALNGATILAYNGVDGAAGTNAGATRRVSFTATTNVATLSFLENSPGRASPIIDDIVVNRLSAAVPEPATWAMMTLGFGAVGFAMRRKKVSTRVRFA